MTRAYLGQHRVSYESLIIGLSYEASFVDCSFQNIEPLLGYGYCILYKKRLTIANLMQTGQYTITCGIYNIIFAPFINLN